MKTEKGAHFENLFASTLIRRVNLMGNIMASMNARFGIEEVESWALCLQDFFHNRQKKFRNEREKKD
jgi:hypothetical protein